MPARGKVRSNSWPTWRIPLSKLRPSAVAVCSRSSSLTNPTVSPTAIASVAGENRRSAIETTYDRGPGAPDVSDVPDEPDEPDVSDVPESGSADASAATTTVPW